jgi:hypothetical protein
MSEQRLSKSLREHIVEQLLHKKFDAAEQALEAREASLALEVYNDIYPSYVQEQMNALPEGWLAESTVLAVTFNGQYDRFDLSKPGKRFLACTDSYTAKRYECTHALTKVRDRIKRDGEALKQSRRELRSKLLGTLESFRTVKKLVAEWPEVIPYIPAWTPTQTTALAVPIATLNMPVGLP